MSAKDADTLDAMVQLLIALDLALSDLVHENAHLLVGGDTLWRPRLRRLMKYRDALNGSLFDAMTTPPPTEPQP